MPASGKFRVFISYSHDDPKVFETVYSTLKQIGLQPTSDKDLAAGLGFTEQIQTKISHAHIFIPILTPNSHKRGWVHQEIGYATAMRVPCVPICKGKLPDGMIRLAHAVVVDEELQTLEPKLRQVSFARLVEDAARQWVPPSGCAREPEERAQMIEQFADAAIANVGASCVRIQGGLSSFSIPDEAMGHPLWAARYGNQPRSQYAYEMFRRERIALEKHASQAGVRMIINFGIELDGDYGPGVKRARMSILLRFLESLTVPNEHIVIALVPKHSPDLTISVGDWYCAESSAGRPVRGVIQTVFLTHAPTVSSRIAEFDRKLDSLLAEQGVAACESKQIAITRMRELIAHLPASPSCSDKV